MLPHELAYYGAPALVSVCAIVFAITFLILRAPKGWFPVAVPVERSNHKSPVLSGGGVGIALMLAVGVWAMPSFFDLTPEWFVKTSLAILVLLTVSLIDDMRGLPFYLRLMTHFAAVLMVLLSMEDLPFSEVIGQNAAKALGVLALVWFINLYNFMDGIDGICVVETVSIGIGIAAVSLAGGLGQEFAYAGLLIAACGLGFAPFNWHPARIFMGDAGSVPLGFACGLALLFMAMSNSLAAALILPAYYVSDASYTFLRRLIAGKKVWQAHSEHAYQKAVRSGMRHDRVALMVAALNIVLCGLAVLSVVHKETAVGALVCGYGASFGLMYYFHNSHSKRPEGRIQP